MRANSSCLDAMPYKPIEDCEQKCYEPALLTTDSFLETISCVDSVNVTSLFDTTELSSHTVDDLLDDVSQVLNTNEIDCGSTEPTPIEPNRINIVDKVPLEAFSWYHDKSVSISLHDLFAETNRDIPACYRELSTQLPSFPVDSIYRANSDDTSVLNMNDQKGYTERWNERYQDLVDFQRKYKHCLVPLNWPSNPALAHWVKRQRYQYTLKLNGSHSTLTKDREEALQRLGFVWDSHAALWEERLNELQCFKERHGHCHVPSRYRENSKLSIWVKCQRRQFKLLTSGEKSNMTFDRMNKLRDIGFVFEPRKRKN